MGVPVCIDIEERKPVMSPRVIQSQVGLRDTGEMDFNRGVPGSLMSLIVPNLTALPLKLHYRMGVGSFPFLWNKSNNEKTYT